MSEEEKRYKSREYLFLIGEWQLKTVRSYGQKLKRLLYASGSTEQSNVKTVVMKNDECIPLKSLLKKYPTSISDSKLMKALLMDYYPENKLIRNLLMTCVEEKILVGLLGKKNIDNIEIYKYEKTIIDAHGCSSDIAKRVVGICVEATRGE